MRLNYRVLVIDDELEQSSETKLWIEDFLRDDIGFIPQVDLWDGEGNSLPEIFGDKSFDWYDVIIVDCNLNNISGENKISLIRENNSAKYTDIIFYSSSPVSELRNKISISELDGVYCVPKGNLEFEFKSFIKTQQRKINDVNNVRGLFISELSEIDSIVSSMLLEHSWNESHFYEECKDSADKHSKKNDEVSSFTFSDSNHIKKLIMKHLSLHPRVKCLIKIGKLTEGEVEDYWQVITARNHFAHGVEKVSSDSSITFYVVDMKSGDLKEKIYTNTEILELRKKIPDLKSLLESKK